MIGPNAVRSGRDQLANSLSKPRVPSILGYSLGAVVLTIVAGIAFKSQDLGIEFAMSMFGSLIGGFLGALLAAVLLFDMYSRIGRDDS